MSTIDKKRLIKKIGSIMLLGALIISMHLAAFAQTKTAEDILRSMTLEEKVAQMFIVMPEQITGVDNVTMAGTATRNAIEKYPVGGIIYMDSNLVSKNQTKSMLTNTQKYSTEITGLPMFLCVDEEGGTVSRLSGKADFGMPAIENMCSVGETKNYQRADEIGRQLGKGLNELGFNVDFAPVADVITNEANAVVKKRSFGKDATLVSEMSGRVAKGLAENNVLATYKHFPGHGATAGDTHNGYAYTDRTLDEMMKSELVPFADAAKNNIPLVMVAHISAPKVTGDDTPASLSKTMVTDVLRNKLGYKGLVITDALNMGAVTQQYTSAQAAVAAIKAGNDLILMPQDFKQAYEGVIAAVKSGEISEARINESVKRIISQKLKMD